MSPRPSKLATAYRGGMVKMHAFRAYVKSTSCYPASKTICFRFATASAMPIIMSSVRSTIG